MACCPRALRAWVSSEALFERVWYLQDLVALPPTKCSQLDPTACGDISLQGVGACKLGHGRAAFIPARAVR